MKQEMCPHCGWLFDVSRGPLVPQHGCEGHALYCPGTGQHPRNPESDHRPLWKDLPPEKTPADRIAELENELRQANKQVKMFQGLKDAAVNLAVDHEREIDRLSTRLAVVSDDGPTMLREVAFQIEHERAIFRRMAALLNEAVEHLPGWAGVNDDAHGWYVRVKDVLRDMDDDYPEPPHGTRQRIECPER